MILRENNTDTWLSSFRLLISVSFVMIVGGVLEGNAVFFKIFYAIAAKNSLDKTRLSDLYLYLFQITQ